MIPDDYAVLKALDAALGIADPEQAAVAINAQTVTVAKDIPTEEARQVILLTGEWVAIKRLAAMPLSGQTPMTGQDQAIMAAGLCIDTMTLTGTLHFADEVNWAAVQPMIGALQAAGVLSAASAAKWNAMRNQVRKAFQVEVSGNDIVAARNYE